METDSDHRSSGETSSLIKPFPMYYVDQFQRLYEQSPMAKMFQQGLTVKQSPKSSVLRGGCSRNSTTAKSFKIPLVTPKKSMPAKCAQRQDSQPIEHDKELPKARSSAGPRIREGLSARTLEGSLSDFNSTNTRDSPQDRVGIIEGRQSFLSPQPRLHQGLPSQNSRRKRTPNLHILIQKLASPDKERNPEVHSMCGSGVGIKRGGRIPDDLCTPTNSHPRLTHEREDNIDVSGAIRRTNHVKSRVDMDPEPSIEESNRDNLEAGAHEGRKRSVPQRRLHQDYRPASPRDYTSHPSQESNRNTLSSMREVDGLSNQTSRATQVLTLSPLVTPKESEVPLSDDTPVNHRSDRLKTRSKGSKRYVGGPIRSLQAAEPESLRSEIPYKGKMAGAREASEDESDDDDDNTERESPVDERVESEDETAEDDLDKRRDEETTVRKEASETSDPTDAGIEEQMVDSNDGSSLDEPIHEENNHPEKVERGDGRHRNKSSTSDETPRIPKKKSETIINRWIVKPVPRCKGVCVEGHRVGDEAGQFWHSTAIMVRVKPRLLATKSGTLYRLSGRMDRALAMEQGFSEPFVRSFQKGFPPNWRELLYDHFTEADKMELRIKSNEPTHQKEPVGLSPVPSLTDQTLNDSTRKVKKRNPAESTPQNVCIKDLHRSSSGRLLKPPLAYWTGQRIRHNTSLDFVEILSGTEDLTSVSAYKIILQESLEIGPREVRAKIRKFKKEKAMDASTQKKLTTQLEKNKYQEEESDRDNTSTSCLDTDTDFTKVPISRNQQRRKAKGKDSARRAVRVTRNTAASSDNTDAPQPDATLGSEGRAKSSSSKRKRGRPSKRQLAASDDSGMAKPIVDSRRGIQSHEMVTMHASSRQECQKQPPPPRKNRVRKIEDRGTRHQSGAPVSPLYYQGSPGTENEVRSDFSGKTSIGVERSSESQGSVDSPGSSDQGLCNEKSRPELFQTKHPTKASGAPATLNLQQEILAVVEKHKQGRIAKMRERSVRITASSADRIKVCNSSSTSDVYDLSDDDEPDPQRVLFTHTSTTAGESVSNWSEEGDKSVNMTWVTRSKPRRRVYGALEDPNYNTEETTTETTTVSNGENPSNVNNISSSDAETLVTKRSEKSDSLGPLRSSYKKSSGSRSRKVPQRTPVQTSEDDQTIERPVAAQVSRSSRRRFTNSEASSEDTDDTSKHQKQPVHRGLSKKAVVIQRHQPRRNCQKTENNSETRKTPQNHVTESKNQAAAWHQKAHSKPTATSQVSEQDSQGGLGTNRLHQERTCGSSIKANVTQKGRVQNEKTRDRPSNGTPSVEDVNEESILQADEPELSQRSTKLGATNSSATKSSIEQSKQQENQAKTSIALTAKAGTMKRKRQLRDLVEQHNRGYEDDIFESTPFKKQKKLKIPLGEWEIDDEGEDGPAGKTPGSARFKTPSVRYQGVLPLSDKKTPYSNLISPGLLPSVDRKHIDQYIHGLQKKKKSRVFTQRSLNSNKQVSRGVAKSSGSASLTKAMKGKMADMFDVTPVSDSDPDEDQDYYWSDEER